MKDTSTCTCLCASIPVQQLLYNVNVLTCTVPPDLVRLTDNDRQNLN